ncbi:putative transposase [Escherichia coli 2-222-05_S4_C3]|nr:putative transposase [Escherichia coli 2720900]EMX85771.1 putative transposase [Escherichia coli BCE001_MS16]KEO07567.1 putative transposase [Escherichia coli 2-222-05_S4_C3]
MPAFEWVHVQLHQQKGMISLSPPTICNSAPSTPPRQAGGSSSTCSARWASSSAT